ncbi:MAG: four helix bundle protein [Candidatus Paceibacterota bacterium]|jgi:four helix bundle protein
MQFKRFEDLPVWKLCRDYVNLVFRTIDSNERLKKDFSTADQFRRASLSTMLNVAEGFERGSNKEFANFLNIAKGSAGEVRSILYTLLDNRYISKEDFDSLNEGIIEISSQLSTFRSFLLKNILRKK